MEENEQLYLKKTLSVIQKKLDNAIFNEKRVLNEFEERKKDLGQNFTEYSRNEELAEQRSIVGDKEFFRDELLKEINKINLQKNSPYFARIDFTPQGKKQTQKVYIGVGNVIDDKKIYVADWRAPISSMYYDFNLGDALFFIGKDEFRGQISLKRQYKIEDSKLLSYFDTDMTIEDEILQDILSKNVTVKMKQIISSIQKEQNIIVRNDKDESMLVQGIAGSGKTSIALHRAAYLLYRHRDSIKSSDIIIISPNNIFSSYISEVLPQLGEDNLVETTFSQIVRSEIKRPVQTREALLDNVVVKPTKKDLEELSYKSSYEYLDSLLRFLKGPFLETYSPQDLSYCIKETSEGEKEFISFPASQTRELFFKSFKGYDLFERINKIAWQYAMTFTEARHYTKEQNAALRDRFKRILYSFLPIKDVEKVYQIFMARENLSTSRGTSINYMDKGTYLLIKHYIYGFEHDFNAKYLIIDEMQDFTPVDIYMFKKLWKCPCIVVGDVHQCIEKNLSPEYLQITADFLGCRLVQLNKTYRSTKEIAMFAHSMIGQTDIEFVNRHGQKPTYFKTNDQSEEIANIINNECKDFDHIAIICKCNSEANALARNLKKKIKCTVMNEPEDYNNRVLITTCATAKGIEFDAVIIPNADKENYKNTIDKNILYVSSTRALHKLFFLSEKEITPLIDNNFLQKA